MVGENATPKRNGFTMDILCVQHCNSCEEVILHSCSAVMLSAGEVCGLPCLK